MEDISDKNQPNDDISVNSSSSLESEEFGWIGYFLTLKGNEFFCHVDTEFITDSFNLTGLSTQVENYKIAFELINDQIDLDDPQHADVINDQTRSMLETDAEIIYGLIHASYILTNRGLHCMLEKYRHNEFGTCPRVNCNGQATLPCGISDIKGKASVKLFCPKCDEIYRPKTQHHENIDGAFFGTTFAHLFFLIFPELKSSKSKDYYIAKVFGFKLHSSWHSKSIEAARKAQFELNQEKKLQAQEQQQLLSKTQELINK